MEGAVDNVWIRCYGELNDLLPAGQRQRAVAQPLFLTRSVKDAIEALGVPHTEVDLILVNGEPVDLDHPLRSGDRVSVYPPFTSLDLGDLPRLQPPPLPEARFVLDTHLGRLAAYLRMLGFDALYQNDYRDEVLADISRREDRILLTRDRGLLKRSEVRRGYLIRSNAPQDQAVEVLRRYRLSGAVAPLTRCLHCNGRLRPVDKAEVADRLPPRTREFYHEFATCSSCGRVYWPGSHYRRMRGLIEETLAQSGE